eukprot:scaffold2648_cov258-Pinguiococcus_pyrenoidosus.AAC.3
MDGSCFGKEGSNSAKVLHLRFRKRLETGDRRTDGLCRRHRPKNTCFWTSSNHFGGFSLLFFA